MRPMRIRFLLVVLLAVILLCGASIALYYFPPVHSRLAWRLESLRTQVHYALNPPQEVVFVPQDQQGQIEAIVEATVQAFLAAAPTETATPALTATGVGPTSTPEPTLAPTLTPTPIPAASELTGFTHEYQKFNNCGPATLSMGLTYWGWQGNQIVTRAWLRPRDPEIDDKNVSPHEMVNYVEAETDLKALMRVGGDLETLKRLVAAGFPVVVEKGFEPPGEDWMGHYTLISGYDDDRGRFLTQDAYVMADFPSPYDEFLPRWRDFNYVYVVAYPPERETEVLEVLGAHADPTYNYQAAAERALQETSALSGRDAFFAWFNLGSNRTALGDYAGAAEAYDQAFILYSTLPNEQRPWRMLWYQFGPLEAYYHTGRFGDVIRLADTTLSFLEQPTLEEALFWRGLAKEGQGDVEGAIADLTRAYRLNPNSTGAAAHIQRLGAPLP